MKVNPGIINRQSIGIPERKSWGINHYFGLDYMGGWQFLWMRVDGKNGCVVKNRQKGKRVGEVKKIVSSLENFPFVS